MYRTKAGRKHKLEAHRKYNDGNNIRQEIDDTEYLFTKYFLEQQVCKYDGDRQQDKVVENEETYRVLNCVNNRFRIRCLRNVKCIEEVGIVLKAIPHFLTSRERELLERDQDGVEVDVYPEHQKVDNGICKHPDDEQLSG